MFDAVLRDFFEGVGMGVPLFLMALPIAAVVRWLGGVPATWPKALHVFILFCLAHGCLRTFVSNDLMGFANILLIPSALYLPCAWAVSAKGGWLWRGFGMLSVPLALTAAIVAAVVVRSA